MTKENEEFWERQIPKKAEEDSFDKLSIELAEGTFTRGRVLKFMGAVLLSGLGAMVGINPAEARRRKKSVLHSPSG